VNYKNSLNFCVVARVISRNLKLGGIEKCLGEGGCKHAREAQIHIRKQKKEKNYTEFRGRGVVSQLGGGIYPA